MGGRHRKDLECNRIDSAASAVRCDPESPTAGSAFVARALAAQPELPAWIAWLHDRAGEQWARLEYQMHYPLDYGGSAGARMTEEWLIIQRAYRAEYAARSVERARRFYRAQPGIVHAHTPELPDDAEFYAALESGREWTGHWYSRDPLGAWGLSETSS
ncbi:hypothetical protein [Nocardia sp. NPDC047654]|uniref:hypothetical protein n=1 Tax=Nocardia sp. NPDC047654 TaxID=3364314 RepID=UPI003716CF1A